MTTTGKRGKASRRIRLEDLAANCGVSVSTVSRALSGAAGVRDDIREQIRRAAREYNYALPSSIAGQKIMVVASAAAMIDYARSQFTLNVMQGLEERATFLRASVVTRAVERPEDEIDVLNEARNDELVAGLLFLTLDDDPMLAPTRGFDKPVVLVNGDDPLMQLSSIAPSNRAAAALATEYLIRLGHRRILFLMRRGRRTIERRYEGWRDRMVQDGIATGGLTVEVSDWLPELAADAISDRIGRNGLDFTAILAAGDSLAIGAIKALTQAGISIPGQVSVLGMDGLPQGAFCNPPLSAMRMPMREIGTAAIDLLRELRSGPTLPARRIELACAMLERESCGPAPEIR